MQQILDAAVVEAAATGISRVKTLPQWVFQLKRRSETPSSVVT